MPWLDKPMRRFFSTLIGEGTDDLAIVFSDFVRQARVRAALEYRDPVDRGFPRGSVSVELPRPTPRQVLSEIVAQWSRVHPLVVTRNTGFVCLAEKELADDPSWPLNLEHVPGFQVEAVTVEELSLRVAEAIDKASEEQTPGPERWRLGGGGHYSRSSGLVYDASLVERKVSARIQDGSARDLLCQVAMLLPHCFWLVEAVDHESPDGRHKDKYGRLMLGSWGNLHEKSAEELVGLLKTEYQHRQMGIEGPGFLARDVLRELQTRGPDAIRELFAAYRSSSDKEFTAELTFDCMARVCTWPDNSRAIAAFAASQRSKTTDPEQARDFALLEEDALWSLKQPWAEAPAEPAGEPKTEPEVTSGWFRERSWVVVSILAAALIAIGIGAVWFVRSRRAKSP